MGIELSRFSSEVHCKQSCDPQLSCISGWEAAPDCGGTVCMVVEFGLSDGTAKNRDLAVRGLGTALLLVWLRILQAGKRDLKVLRLI